MSAEDNPLDDIPADKESYEAWEAKQTLDSLEKENAALRKEVNALRARLGEGRKYVEHACKQCGQRPCECPGIGGL